MCLSGFPSSKITVGHGALPIMYHCKYPTTWMSDKLLLMGASAEVFNVFELRLHVVGEVILNHCAVAESEVCATPHQNCPDCIGS